MHLRRHCSLLTEIKRYRDGQRTSRLSSNTHLPPGNPPPMPSGPEPAPPPRGAFLRFLGSVAAFMAPVVAATLVYMVAVPVVLRHGLGETSDLAYMIDQSARHALQRDYDVVILGNSRVFRGLDPEALRLRTQSFAFDDDTFNYYFFKLKWLLDHGKTFRYAIVGVDYFQLTYQNYDRYFVYRDLFANDEFSARLLSPSFGPAIVSHVVDGRLQARGLYVQAGENILRTLAIEHHLPPTARNPRAFLRDDGFYSIDAPSVARPEDRIPRPFGVDPFLKTELERTLALCAARGVRAFLVMPPVRPGELASYTATQRAEFDRIVAGLDVPYWSFAEDPDFAITDFQDVTHLTLAGAKKFTRKVDERIGAWLAEHESAVNR